MAPPPKQNDLDDNLERSVFLFVDFCAKIKFLVIAAKYMYKFLGKVLTLASNFDIIISRDYDIKIGGGIVNKSNIPTYQKIMIPLRLPPEIYNQMMGKVQKRKKELRGYSVNQYLTEILTKDLEAEDNG